MIHKVRASVILAGAALFMARPLMAGDQSFQSGYQPELEEEIKQLIRATDPASGERLFMRKCSSCHDHEKSGGHGKGPHLWGVFGRKAGSIPGFEFSDAMRDTGVSWGYATLNHYLTNTEDAVPGRLMNFRGMKKDKQRARLIAFLRTLNDNPPSLP